MSAEKEKPAAAPAGKRKTARRRRPATAAAKKAKRPSLTLLEIAEKFRRSIPPEEWHRLPSDGSINYRHYLYGHPKRTLED